jgi:carboxyl-terminal processing protease
VIFLKPYRVVLLCLISLLFTGIAGAYSQQKDLIDFQESIIDLIDETFLDDIDRIELIQNALKGLFGELDNYSVFYTPKEANEFLLGMKGTYRGVGIVIGKMEEFIMVTKVFSASPAEKTGIWAGDRIVSVDGQDIIGSSTDEAASLIRGEEGTTVTLEILRDGEEELFLLDVVRDEIKINPVTYEIMGDVGYISVYSFNMNLADYFGKALESFDKEGIKKIILDLRNNPGGEVGQAVALGEHFIPHGIITTLNYKSEMKEDEEFYSYLLRPRYELVVLVNGMSASASEIIAGAVQDTGVGTLVGTTTFGKSRVQNLIPLLTPSAFRKYEKQIGLPIVDGYQLITDYNIAPLESELIGWCKMTTGEYLTPNGRRIDGTGIEPDIFVEDYELIEDIDINSIQDLEEKYPRELGSESFETYSAERMLRILGYTIENPDMILDELTLTAIADFQSKNSLYLSGALDTPTQRALNLSIRELRPKVDTQLAKALELLSD